MTKASLGFVIGRHIAKADHVALCSRAHASVRRFYPDSPILIVDDNSPLEGPDDYDAQTSVVRSTFPGAGEFGLYYYYHHTRAFDRAVFLHDSMVINRPLDLSNAHAIKYLWHFAYHESLWQHVNDVERLLSELADREGAERKYRSNAWTGMFGCCCSLTWSCLDRIVQRYQLFRLLPKVNTRATRCAMERVLGILFSEELRQDSPSLNGNIFELPGAFVRDQQLTDHAGYMDKTWHGR